MSFIRMSSLYPFQGSQERVELFGYCTKSVPGIEIVGLGKHGRAMKEKFVYLSKVRGIKFPPYKFILCAEGEIEGKKFKTEEYRYLELPLLLMLWKMADVLPIFDLTDCFASGKISVQGEVDYLNLNESEQAELFSSFSEETMGIPKLIAPRRMELKANFGHIYLEELLGPSFKGAS